MLTSRLRTSVIHRLSLSIWGLFLGLVVLLSVLGYVALSAVADRVVPLVFGVNALALLATAMGISATSVQAADLAAGQAKAASCAVCHGPMGLATAPNTPNLAGQPEPYLAEQLKQYRSGKREHAVMAVIAKPLTDAELDRMAEVAVRVGLNLQPGQDLILTAAVEALPLVRRVVAAAGHRAGMTDGKHFRPSQGTVLKHRLAALPPWRHPPSQRQRPQPHPLPMTRDWVLPGPPAAA